MSSEANVSMRDEDLDRIEATLGVKLPPEYRATMRAYPFPPDSSAAELWSPPDADWVIRTSRAWSETGLYDRPRSSRYVALGGDGGEEQYILDLATSPAGAISCGCRSIFQAARYRIRQNRRSHAEARRSRRRGENLHVLRASA